ncbi:conserved hypothetical protein [Neospora caninum Liverpool]|uniref:Uncharacterized protein n=1 Tax=Neospora caninum (strain Liverpool) TaxID=572307 RepID=F0VH82_NEOCL|nr:conserved hypothetical protein [Neospora caninum Liverpool]CBZ53076.1 conserved hypothetical protein [Neospora caninum Liverpool]CEL67060.1 TPA: hypothetical protein BN1204_028650 [Neospora caninum Liverpool]|eukprot:XP_003883108.1 conserved hypothetical protein [Neospora caninum Liverpool]
MPELVFPSGQKAPEGGVRNAELLALLKHLQQRQTASSSSSPSTLNQNEGQTPGPHASSSSGVSVALLQLLQQRQQVEQKELLLRLAEGQQVGRARAPASASSRPGRPTGPRPPQVGSRASACNPGESLGNSRSSVPASTVCTGGRPATPDHLPREGQALKQLFAHLVSGGAQAARFRTERQSDPPASARGPAAFPARPPSPVGSDNSDEAAFVRGLREGRRGEPPSGGSRAALARRLQFASDSEEAMDEQGGPKPVPLQSARSRGREPSRDGGAARLGDLVKLHMQQQTHERILRQQLAALTSLHGEPGGSQGRSGPRPALPSRSPDPGGGAANSQAALLQHHQALLQQQRQQVHKYLVEGAVAGAECASPGPQRGDSPQGVRAGASAPPSDACFRRQGGGASACARDGSQGRLGGTPDLSAFASLTQPGLLGGSEPSAALRALQQRLAAAAAAGAAAAGGSSGLDGDASDHDAQLLSKLQQSVAVASYNLLRLSSPNSADAAAALRGLGETLGRIASRNEARGAKPAADFRPASLSLGGVGPGGCAGASRRSETRDVRFEGLRGRPPAAAEGVESAVFPPQSRAGASLPSSRLGKAPSEPDRPPPFSVASPRSASWHAAHPASTPSLGASSAVYADSAPAAGLPRAAKSPEESAARERAAAARAAAVSAAAAVVEPPLDPTRERVLRKHVQALRPYFEVTFSLPGFFGGSPRAPGSKTPESGRKGHGEETGKAAPRGREGESLQGTEASSCSQKENACAKTEASVSEAGARGVAGAETRREDGQEKTQRPKQKEGSGGKQRGEEAPRGSHGGTVQDGDEQTAECVPAAGHDPPGASPGAKETGEQGSTGDAGEGVRARTGICLEPRASRASDGETSTASHTPDILPPPLVSSLEDELPPLPAGLGRSTVGRRRSKDGEIASAAVDGDSAEAATSESAASAGPGDSPHLSVLRWRADASFLFFDIVQHLRESCDLVPDPVVSRLLSRHPRNVPGASHGGEAERTSGQASLHSEGEKEETQTVGLDERISSRRQERDERRATSTRASPGEQDARQGREREPSLRSEEESGRSLSSPRKAHAVDNGTDHPKEKENESRQAQLPPSLPQGSPSTSPTVADGQEAGPKGASAQNAVSAGKEKAGSPVPPDSDSPLEEGELLWDGGAPATERWCSALIEGWSADARQLPRDRSSTEEDENSETMQKDSGRGHRSSNREASVLETETPGQAPYAQGDLGEEVGAAVENDAEETTRDAWWCLQADQERLEDLTMPHVEIQRLPLEWPRSLAAVCMKALQQPDAEKSHSSLVTGVWDTVWGACRDLWAKRPRVGLEASREAASEASEAARGKEEEPGDPQVPANPGDGDETTTASFSIASCGACEQGPAKAEQSEDAQETCLVCEALWAAAAFPDAEDAPAERRPFRHFGGCPTYALSGGSFRLQTGLEVAPSSTPFRGKLETVERTPERRSVTAGGMGHSAAPNGDYQEEGDSASRDADSRESSATAEGGEAEESRPVETKFEDASEGSAKSQEKSKERRNEKQKLFWLAHAHHPVAVDLWRPPLALLEERFVSEVEREVAHWRVQDIRERRRRRDEEEATEMKQLRLRLEALQRRKAAGDPKQEEQDREDGESAADIERLFEAEAWEEKPTGGNKTPGHPDGDEPGAEVAPRRPSSSSLASASAPSAPACGADGSESFEAEAATATQTNKSALENRREHARRRCVDAWNGVAGEREAEAARWIKRHLGSHALRRAACGLSPLLSPVHALSPASPSPSGAGVESVETEDVSLPQTSDSPETPGRTLSLHFLAGTEDGWAVFASPAETGEKNGVPALADTSPGGAPEEQTETEGSTGEKDVHPTAKAANGKTVLLRRFPLASLGFFHGCRLAVEMLREKAGAREREMRGKDPDGEEETAVEPARRQSEALREEEEELRCLLAQHSAASPGWRWWREFTSEKEEEAAALSALSLLPPQFSLPERSSEAEEDAPAQSEDEKPERVLPFRTTRSSRLMQEKLSQLHTSRALSAGASAPATPQAENGKAARATAAVQRAAGAQAPRGSAGSAAGGKKIRILVVGCDDVSDVTQDCRQWLLRRLRLFGAKRQRAAVTSAGVGLQSFSGDVDGETERKRQKQGEETARRDGDGRPQGAPGEGVRSPEEQEVEMSTRTNVNEDRSASPEEAREHTVQESLAARRLPDGPRGCAGGEATWREGVKDGNKLGRESPKDEEEGADTPERAADGASSSQASGASSGCASRGGKRRKTELASQLSSLTSPAGPATRLLLERLCELRAHASGTGPYSGSERLLLRFLPEASCSGSPCEEKSEDGGEKEGREPSCAWSSEGEDARGSRDRGDATTQRHTANTYSLRHRRRGSHSPVPKGPRQSPSSSSRQHSRAAYAAQDACARQMSPDASPVSGSRSGFSFSSLSHLRGGRLFAAGGRSGSGGHTQSANGDAAGLRHR